MEIRDLVRLTILLFIGIANSFGQEQFIDHDTKRLFDSLDSRINYLENEIPRLSRSKSMKYFFKKRELDHTIFLSHYHRYVFDENLDKARDLINSRIKAARKRQDPESVKFYSDYAGKLTNEQANQQRRYQRLFAKEKNFKKEWYLFIEAGDDYSLKRAERMIVLAKKYAREKNLESVLRYLNRYQKLTEATIFDYYSEFELARLTDNENQFNKVFHMLIESDSLESIRKAGILVNHCYTYSAGADTKLDTNYFAMQKNRVATSISDYHDRKGNNASLLAIEGQSLIARLDTLNRYGIYKWHDRILVISHFLPKGNSEQVKTGEAIIIADRNLLEYIRVNRLAKLGKDVKLGHTYLIPFQSNDKSTKFLYDPNKKKYQYMVCYTLVKDINTTRDISKYLPPLQFDIEMVLAEQ